MPVFFLHICDDGEMIEDLEGQEFTSVHSARDEAAHAAREIAAEKVRQGQVVDGQTVEVADETGDIVAVVMVREQVRLDDADASAAA